MNLQGLVDVLPTLPRKEAMTLPPLTQPQPTLSPEELKEMFAKSKMSIGYPELAQEQIPIDTMPIEQEGFNILPPELLFQLGGFTPNDMGFQLPGFSPVPEGLENRDPYTQEAPTAKGGEIRAYHGTNEDFDTFDLSKAKSSSGSQSAGGGIWFTDDKRVAAEFADWSSYGGNKGKPIIKEAILDLKNPKIYESKDGWDAFQQYKFDLEKFKTKKSSHIQTMRSMTEPDPELSSEGQFIGKKLGEISLNMVDDVFDYQGFRDSLKKQGYDGIILKNSLTDAVGDKNPEPHTQYLVFDPKQIKLSPKEGK